MNSSVKRFAVNVLRWVPMVVQDKTIELYLINKKKKIERQSTPTAIILYITSRCNLRCRHCFYWDSLNKNIPELNGEEISKIIDSLDRPVYLSLTGGEPFLRKDIREITNSFIAMKKAKDIGIASNGFFTEAIVAFCERFCSEHNNTPLSVQISLDGMEETHDSIRGMKGSFKRALATINRLQALASLNNGFSVSAGIAVQKSNLSEVTELLDLLGTKGMNIRINLIRGESSGTFGVAKGDSSHFDPRDGSDIALSTDEVRFLYDVLCKKNEKCRFWTKRHKKIYEIGMQVLEKRKKILDCYAGTIDCVIYSNGDVAFCELTKPIGNLRDYGFNIQKLWNSSNAVSMRSKVNRCFCTHGCNISTSLMFETDIVKEAILKNGVL